MFRKHSLKEKKLKHYLPISVDDKVSEYYNKKIIGNSILYLHKEIAEDGEHKFFCTSYKNTDLIVMSPVFGGIYGYHRDLLEIALNHIKVSKENLKKSDFYKTEFMQTAISGTLKSSKQDAFINYHYLDAPLNPGEKNFKKRKIPKTVKRSHKRIMKAVRKISKTQRKIYQNNLNKTIRMANLRKIKGRPKPKFKPKRRF